MARGFTNIAERRRANPKCHSEIAGNAGNSHQRQKGNQKTKELAGKMKNVVDINECSLQLSQDTFYEIYQNIKSTIKQVYPNSFGISYHKKPSFVAFTEGQRKATIYIINEVNL